MGENCDVCQKRPKEQFRVCGECAKTHDSTTLDLLRAELKKSA